MWLQRKRFLGAVATLRFPDMAWLFSQFACRSSIAVRAAARISGSGSDGPDGRWMLKGLLIRLRTKGCHVFVAKASPTPPSRSYPTAEEFCLRTRASVEACDPAAFFIATNGAESVKCVRSLLRPLSRWSRYRLTVRSKSSLKERRLDLPWTRQPVVPRPRSQTEALRKRSSRANYSKAL